MVGRAYDVYRSGEQHIVEKLNKAKTPIILVINKIDTVKKEEILTFIAAYKDLCNFAEIIPVSALKGENTEVLIDTIYKYIPEGPMYYDEDTITDQPERQIVAELVREKSLRLLSDEIPHGITVVIDRMKERIDHNNRAGHNQVEQGNGLIDIDATIICERDSHKGIIIGKGGRMLKQIGIQARKEIENLLDCRVNLQLWVKVKKDWRNSNFLIKNYGFNANDFEL